MKVYSFIFLLPIFICNLNAVQVITIDNDLEPHGFSNFYEAINGEQGNWIQGFSLWNENLGFRKLSNSSKDIIEIDFNNHLQDFGSHINSYSVTLLYYKDNQNAQLGWDGQNVKFEFHVDDYVEFQHHDVSVFIAVLGTGTKSTLAEASITSTGYYSLEALLPTIGGASNSFWEIQVGFKFSGMYQNVTEETGYIKISAVPEPSTYALILGAVALGFTIIRRK